MGTIVNAKVNSEHLKSLIKSVDEFRHQKDDLRMLNGFFIETEENHLVIVSTDRYRLGIGKVVLESKTGNLEKGVLVDGKSLLAISKIKSQKGDILDLNITEKGIIVTDSGLNVYQVPAIEQDFPKYKSLFPNEYQGTEKIAWNPQYLSEIGKGFAILNKALGTETPMKVSFNGELKPTIFSMDEQKLALQVLLMPMKIAS
jgi:hypothetical protein